MSNDDLGGLAPLGKNPLDGDLLGDMSLPDASPLAASGTLIDDELTAASAVPESGGAAMLETAAEKPREPKVKGPGFLSKLSQSNPYTVMLFASLVALLIGVICLLLEWRSYHFDTKAKEARQSVQMAVPVQSVTGVVSLPGAV